MTATDLRFVVADVVEILEAAGWSSEQRRVDRGTITVVTSPDDGAEAHVSRFGGRVLVDLDLFDAGDRNDHAVAHLSIDLSAGALRVARMIVAAAEPDED